MEEGSLRCDANVSVRPVGQKELGTKTEIKNINSFRGVERAIEYEAMRQAELLEEGGTVVQETRTWDEKEGVTKSMRKKEEANDYRYFPEPDLVPFTVSEEYIEEIRKTLPELPDARKERYMESYGLTSYDADYLTNDKARADYFEAMVAAGADPKEAANWLMGDFAKKLSQSGLEMAAAPVTAAALADLLGLIGKGTIPARSRSRSSLICGRPAKTRKRSSKKRSRPDQRHRRAGRTGGPHHRGQSSVGGRLQGG